MGEGRGQWAIGYVEALGALWGREGREGAGEGLQQLIEWACEVEGGAMGAVRIAGQLGQCVGRRAVGEEVVRQAGEGAGEGAREGVVWLAMQGRAGSGWEAGRLWEAVGRGMEGEEGGQWGGYARVLWAVSVREVVGAGAGQEAEQRTRVARLAMPKMKVALREGRVGEGGPEGVQAAQALVWQLVKPQGEGEGQGWRGEVEEVCDLLLSRLQEKEASETAPQPSKLHNKVGGINTLALIAVEGTVMRQWADSPLHFLTYMST